MRAAYMHLAIRTNGKTPRLIGADIMSEKTPTILGHIATAIAYEAHGETYEEARANLLAALDNKRWRWLLTLWERTGRK